MGVGIQVANISILRKQSLYSYPLLALPLMSINCHQTKAKQVYIIHLK